MYSFYEIETSLKTTDNILLIREFLLSLEEERVGLINNKYRSLPMQNE